MFRVKGLAAAWLAALILISWVPTGLAQGQDADASADDDKPYNAATSNLEVGKFTADELLNMGMTAYRAQRWEEALNSFGAFLRDYGSAREAAGAITRVRPLIAMCLVQLKRWGEALQAIEEVFPLEKEIDPGTLEQIYFWKGACLFFLEEFGPAREALNIFAEKFPQSQKFTEALLLTATSYVLEGDFEGSVDFCRKAKNILRGPDRSQIVVLELYSLLEIPKTDEAYELVKEEFERLDDMVQLAAFQSMTLKLGSQFLVEKKYHAAIGCLQRLWPLEQILGRQEERLNILKQRLANAEARKDDPFNIHKLNQLIGKIERELKSFKKIEHWDSATRMRVATAYIQLERYREAALVLDDMLRDLPADPIVEQASMNLIKLWMLIESWDRAVEASALFQEKFPKSPQVPMAMILRGQSLQFMGNYDEALKEFEKLVDEHPDDVLAAKGEFMIGFTLIMQDEFELAIETFEGVEKEFPNSDVLADTLYWKGMTHSMAKRHEIALGMMDQYLKKYPQGTEAGEAAFRRAYSLHGLKRYDEGIAGFLKFVKDYPQSDRIGEARLLAGDAYLAQGKIDEGAKIYRQIPPDDVSFFEEAWFKIGKAYKQQDRFADLELHMRDFVRTRTESPRVAEAVYWQGWAQKQQGHEDRAREIYWETLRKYGNNPAVSSVEDLFEGLGKLYGSQNQLPDLIAELTRMTDAAKAEKQDIMALRLLWGRAMLLEKREPENARNLLIQAASFTKFDSSSSRILVDIADAYLAAGDIPKATEFYRETLRWNPRSLQKDRIFMGLGELAEKDGRKEEALKYYQRFAEETIMSIRLGEILARKADIEIELGKKEEARGTLDQILATKSIKGKRKAETLLKMGDVMRSQGKLQAASQYYERVYLLYGKWGDLVARAYLNRGEVLESLDNKLEAAKTYRELEKREDLAQLEPAIAARRKLEPLRALLPKEEAVPAAAAAPQATEVAQP